MCDNSILIVNSFYIVLIILISTWMFHLQRHTCELAGEVLFFFFIHVAKSMRHLK